jgi:hypothetical protein
LHHRCRRDGDLRAVAESATEERPDEKAACRGVLGRAQRPGASRPEHQGEVGRSQCRDEQDTFVQWEHRGHWGRRKSARNSRQLDAEMPVQQETGSLAPRAALGLQVATDVQALDPAERQPERQERSPELWALLGRRQVEPLLQAQLKPAQRAHPGVAER